ncbi:MAG TPA: hypothetical protein VGB18_01475 [Candidatus Thermoplasmatota archaeon]
MRYLIFMGIFLAVGVFQIDIATAHEAVGSWRSGFRFGTFEPPPLSPRFEDPPDDAALAVVDVGGIWFEHVNGTTTQVVLEIREITGDSVRACDWSGQVSLDTQVFFEDPFMLHIGWRIQRGAVGYASANPNGPTVPVTLEVTPGSPGFIRLTTEVDSSAWNDYPNRYFRTSIECDGVQDEFGAAKERGAAVPGATATGSVAAVLVSGFLAYPKSGRRR